jgi:hypothetical protein
VTVRDLKSEPLRLKPPRDVEVYCARPERVVAAVALLREGGVSFRVVDSSIVSFPWFDLGLPSQRVLVPPHLADRAHELLGPLVATEAVPARSLQRSVRWPLLLFGTSLVAATVFLLASSLGGPRQWSLAALACLAVSFLSWRRLRRPRQDTR